jgi:hypothetical protein
MADAHKRKRHPKYKTRYRIKNWHLYEEGLAATGALKQRNKHIKAIAAKGVYRWRRESGYYRQSVAENSIYRYKQIIGPRLRARNENSRKVEAVLGCKILNRSRALGIPQSYKVA